MMDAAQKAEEFEMTGGALCLDFANTLGDGPRSNEEHLGGYDDLLRFSRQAETLPAEVLDELERLNEEQPRSSRTAYRRAIGVRETLYRIFASLARGEMPGTGDVQMLNSILHQALGQLRIRERQGTFEWVWGGPVEALDRPLWPIARSAAELLTSEEVNHLRECASETCSWLFVDRSRTRRRRWCDMSTCGNRAKARRHYQRRKQAHASG